MFENMISYTSPISETGTFERILDASPNTGRTLAGTANAVTFQKKLRKKEDDMHNQPAKRVIRPVSDSDKGTAISRKDAHQPSTEKGAVKKHPAYAGGDAEDEAYEPFIGVLIDYTA